MPTFKRGSKLGQSLEEKGILPPKQPKKKRKRNKYGAQKATAGDGTKFDSKKEARRYGELQVMLAMGVIRDLELQVEYPLEPGGLQVQPQVAAGDSRRGRERLPHAGVPDQEAPYESGPRHRHLGGVKCDGT
jgi:hypothetical protein